MCSYSLKPAVRKVRLPCISCKLEAQTKFVENHADSVSQCINPELSEVSVDGKEL